MPIVKSSDKGSKSHTGGGGGSSSSSSSAATKHRRSSTTKAHKRRESIGISAAAAAKKAEEKENEDAKFLDNEYKQNQLLQENINNPSDSLKNSSPKHSHHNRKSKKSTNSFFHGVFDYLKTRKFIFALGAVIGLLGAWYTAQPEDFHDLISLDILNDISLGSFSDFVDDFKGKLPLGIMKEARDIEMSHEADLSEPFTVGLNLRDSEKISANHPVIMIPGVISTGLESWSLEGTSDCPAKPYFRKRLWGSWHMLRAMLLDKSCWLKNLMLDPETGLDPPFFKMRAALGMEAADFFVAGYWIWGRLLENLAAIGYDSGNMMIASYDWRLAFPDLEKRDGYFSKLKSFIEETLKKTDKKTVLVSHSMGSQIVFYFLKWVEAQGDTFGNGGSNWVNDHIEAFVDISGSTLGAPKAIVALLSGEMKDTVQLNSMAVYGLEKFFSRRERADLLRSFGGISSMLPKGGEIVWGDESFAPDDYAGQNVSFGNFIRFKVPKSSHSQRNLTIADSIEYLKSQAPDSFKNMVERSYSYGLATTRKELEENENDPRKWTNPLEVALPNAPNMKMYCFYGVGKPTERGYYYKEEDNKTSAMLNVSIAIEDPNAVVFGEGDGTVSLVTHTMCHKWREENSRFNPGNVKIKIVEMAHEPDRLDIRGGAKTADHVDILGRAELNELVLKVAGGKGESIVEKLISPLQGWAKNMNFGE